MCTFVYKRKRFISYCKCVQSVDVSFCEKVNMTFILTIKHVINKRPVQLCSVFPRSEDRRVFPSARAGIFCGFLWSPCRGRRQ